MLGWQRWELPSSCLPLFPSSCLLFVSQPWRQELTKVVTINIRVKSMARQLLGNGWKFTGGWGGRKCNNSSDMWRWSFHNLNKRWSLSCPCVRFRTVDSTCMKLNIGEFLVKSVFVKVVWQYDHVTRGLRVCACARFLSVTDQIFTGVQTLSEHKSQREV